MRGGQPPHGGKALTDNQGNAASNPISKVGPNRVNKGVKLRRKTKRRV